MSIRSLDERPARICRQRGLERGGSHDVERADRYLCQYSSVARPHLCCRLCIPYPYRHLDHSGIFLILTLTNLMTLILCRQDLSSRLSSSNQEMTINHLERQRSTVTIVITIYTINTIKTIVTIIAINTITKSQLIRTHLIRSELANQPGAVQHGIRDQPRSSAKDDSGPASNVTIAVSIITINHHHLRFLHQRSQCEDHRRLANKSRLHRPAASSLTTSTQSAQTCQIVNQLAPQLRLQEVTNRSLQH